MTDNPAYRRDKLFLAQNNGRKHDPDVFHDVVNRFVVDGCSEYQSQLNALDTMNEGLFRSINKPVF